MTEEMRQTARQLAERQYLEVLIEVDRLSDGSTVYVLGHPELKNCMAQGSSMRDAREELASARYEYILSLLEDGMDVPEPAQRIERTEGTALGNVINITFSETDSETQVKPIPPVFALRS